MIAHRETLRKLFSVFFGAKKQKMPDKLSGILKIDLRFRNFLQRLFGGVFHAFGQFL